MAKYSNGLEDKLNLPLSSITVLESRYLAKNSFGKILETGEDLYKRVAKDIAAGDAFYLEGLKEKVERGIPTDELYKIVDGDERIKKREEEFFELMAKGYFLPNSPTLMNAGNKSQQLSACFVLPIEDSMEGIYGTMKDTALVHKSGGGTGFSFSRLRPNGAFIKGTQSYSPGPISFLKIYNVSTEGVKQGGKRRGANMGILRVNHPDALDWARVKQKPSRLENFNLSIAFTDEEIEAVKREDYILMEDPREGVDYTIDNAKKRLEEISFGNGDNFRISWGLSDDETKIIDNYSNKEIGKVEDGKLYFNAKEFFNTMVNLAWKTGDPGIIFIDKMNKDNPTPEIGEIESTNPCGEQPLLPYESCNLGSINLGKMIEYQNEENLFGELNESLLEKTVRSSVRFLDNVIDRNNYPLKKIEGMTLGNRKIGLGIMGFADYLAKRGISYNSEEAIKEAEKIMELINDVSKDESRKLAKERGVFPNFEKSVYKDKEPIRNATTTTIAPTGTISIINNASSGIEPLFALVAKRNVKKSIGEDLIEINEAFRDYLKKKEIYDKEILVKLTEGKSIDDMLIPIEIKKEIKKLFPCANEVPTEQHLKIQAAFQKYTDNAVSKTINMPSNVTPEDIANAYLMAYEIGCKGITIYRDKSRDDQLLVSAGKQSKLEIDLIKGKRPEVIGKTLPQMTPHGRAYVTLNVLEQDPSTPFEVFINIGKGGRDMAAIGEGYGRMASLSFKYGVPIKEMIEQLEGIGGETQIPGKEKITSLPDALAKGIKEAYNKLNNKKLNIEEEKLSGNFCRECGGVMVPTGGCEVCINCGYSSCG